MNLPSLFNQLDLVGRATSANYTAEYLSWRQGSPELEARFGEPFVSVILGFTSPDDTVAFDTHVYLSHNLSILGQSRLLDPKAIFLLRRAHFFAQSSSAQ